jgi:hypothetical protein
MSDKDGTHVMDEDWDTLIILDACRYDLFDEEMSTGQIQLEGNLEKRKSLGSTSEEFLEENFSSGPYDDTIYVTANPFVLTTLDSPFHSVDHVWKDGWDDEYETVLPETIRDRAIQMHEQYPNKRLIVHFMQPHNPFIGETNIDVRGFGRLRSKAIDESGETESRPDVWTLLQNGEVDTETVWNAYRDNLRHAMPAVRTLVEDIPGKTVISSDHGNLFGDRVKPFGTRIYGHIHNIREPGLIEVPWFVPDYTERRTVVSGEPSVEHTDAGTDVISDRLESLGYV